MLRRSTGWRRSRPGIVLGLTLSALTGTAAEAQQGLLAQIVGCGVPHVAMKSDVSEPADTLTAIVGATVIDGTGAPPLRDGTVLIAGHQIVSVADLVVLSANLLLDIHNIRQTAMVFKEGRQVKWSWCWRITQ